MPPAPKAPPLSELTGRQMQWIGAGYVMCLSSMAGQTVFIAQFNTALRDAFGLSHGQFGLLYTVATLASSVCLVFAGGLADRVAPRMLGLACLAGLAALSVAMSQVNHVLLLGIALFGLRFFGQGMMGHIAMTTMTRWFNRFRGRALALAQLGFPTGEALLPFMITLAIAAVGWREVWLGAAALLVVVFAPLIAFLLRDPPEGRKALAGGRVNPDAAPAGTATGAGWTRGRVLRDPLFYLIIPGFMAPPAIGTLFIFHQAHLAGIKGWDITTFTAFFPLLSLSAVAASLISGALVDRYGAWRIVPLLLVPEGLGCLALALFDPIWVAPMFFVTFGLTTGMMSPVVGSFWAELYGTTHLGAIRALATAALVLATALGPGIAGLLIDQGIALDDQGYFYAAYCLVASLVLLSMRGTLARRSAGLQAG